MSQKLLAEERKKEMILLLLCTHENRVSWIISTDQHDFEPLIYRVYCEAGKSHSYWFPKENSLSMLYFFQTGSKSINNNYNPYCSLNKGFRRDFLRFLLKSWEIPPNFPLVQRHDEALRLGGKIQQVQVPLNQLCLDMGDYNKTVCSKFMHLHFIRFLLWLNLVNTTKSFLLTLH